MNRHSQRGVALVITLILLAVVTLMTVLFLQLSQRDKASVTVSIDLTGARLAAESGQSRAIAQVIAPIAARSNLYAYDLTVSTNYITPGGFRPGINSRTNVGYFYVSSSNALAGNDILLNQANLFYDPRPPVFIVTNNQTGQSDFRFYLDLNRNGRYDPSGLQRVMGPGGVPTAFTENFVGDPEWNGILARSDEPHSPSNRFVGRYAFVVLPAGKTLDLNFIHNRAKFQNPPRITANEGFLRNQGVGSWELNLAGFFRTLNTNIWLPASYLYDPLRPNPNQGRAFDDALDVIRYRYNNNLGSLRSVAASFGTPGVNAFRNDHIDGYSDGLMFLDTRLPGERISPDNTSAPWPGSDNPSGYDTINDLFDGNKTSGLLVNSLQSALTNNDSYNRYTFSRVLAQIGTDSLPASRDKLNLNYVNVGGLSATNFIRWDDPDLRNGNASRDIPRFGVTGPLLFFTNAADRMLRREYAGQITLTNIQIYPTNFYTARTHRLLQLSANLFDATADRAYGGATTYPFLPTVFRPLFGRESTNIFIVGYAEVTDANEALNRAWVDLNVATSRLSVPTIASVNANNSPNVYGVPWVIGAKKGFPNFNELHLESSVLVTRRLEVQKNLPTDTPQFHQSYEIGISNLFGVEAWNSYTQAYPRALELRMTNRTSVTLTYYSQVLSNRVLLDARVTNYPANSWQGGGFRVPMTNSVAFVPNSEFYFVPPSLRPLQPAVSFDRTAGFPIPDWKLIITNRLTFALIDPPTQRIVDFVNLDNLAAGIDITRELAGRTNAFGDGGLNDGSFWATNRVGGAMSPTIGITNQMFVSTNDVLAANDWNSYTQNPLSGRDKERAIDALRKFLGIPPLFDTDDTRAPTGPIVQVPFTPSRRLVQQLRWQVNDPLVHYHIEDLYDPRLSSTNNVQPLPPNGTPDVSNLGQINDQRYRPWGGRPGSQAQADDTNPVLVDPLVRKSDDWDFPTNQFPNVGWLGRVHRGTPWQSVYLKSFLRQADLVQLAGLSESNRVRQYNDMLGRSLIAWTRRAGNPDTYPINDWRLLELFTTAPNDNAARGVLSVNQTNQAAWSAVLSGVFVLTNSEANPRPGVIPIFTATNIEPASPQLEAIVNSINLARTFQPGGAFRSLGEFLSAPALTLDSPYLNPGNANAISDAAYERIPQQILSLVKEDEPYVVIYSFGQSLKPAERSVITAPGPYYNLCTNYQIMGEVVTKTALRLRENPPGQPRGYRGIIESYQILPTD